MVLLLLLHLLGQLDVLGNHLLGCLGRLDSLGLRYADTQVLLEEHHLLLLGIHQLFLLSNLHLGRLELLVGLLGLGERIVAEAGIAA